MSRACAFSATYVCRRLIRLAWLASLSTTDATYTDEATCAARPQPSFPELLSLRPRAYRLRHLLTDEECTELIALGEARLAPSLVGVTDDDSQASWRNSSTMLFDEEVDAGVPLLRRLRRRMCDSALMDERHAEPLQIARYQPDESYSLHLDFDGAGAAPRLATLIVFLNDDFEGGETVFPRVGVPRADGDGGGGGRGALKPLAKLLAAGGEPLLMQELAQLPRYCDEAAAVLRVAPRRGDALLFYSFGADLQPDHDSVHGGCPPRGGPKWIAQQWFTVDTAMAAPRTRGRGAAPPADGADDGVEVPEARGNEQLARQLSERAVERLRRELAGAAAG
eukprot:Transcript_25145.p2 GENE.Transcript_25145~~Transcript_25145.p2  ORF type:complete len:337 (+),score=86.01 Transcript_25145:909-1919(+)